MNGCGTGVIFHRVTRCMPEGYITRGDTQYHSDGYIPRHAILGRITRIEYKGLGFNLPATGPGQTANARPEPPGAGSPQAYAHAYASKNKDSASAKDKPSGRALFFVSTAISRRASFRPHWNHLRDGEEDLPLQPAEGELFLRDIQPGSPAGRTAGPGQSLVSIRAMPGQNGSSPYRRSSQSLRISLRVLHLFGWCFSHTSLMRSVWIFQPLEKVLHGAFHHQAQIKKKRPAPHRLS